MENLGTTPPVPFQKVLAQAPPSLKHREVAQQQSTGLALKMPSEKNITFFWLLDF